MNSQPSSAIENGLTSQLTPDGGGDAAPVLPDLAAARARSIFSSIGTIISQTSTATGRLTCATVASPSAWNDAGHDLAERDAGDDAQRDPERQVALENAHRRALRRRVSDCVGDC